MNYSNLLQQLYTINMRGMKFGLENMQKLDNLLGNPSQAFQSVHVAGSNGKGSVCTKIATALQETRRIGLYTSPHIATFRERIRIQGMMISETETAQLLEEIFVLLEQTKIPATFFEVTTLLSFLHFARQKVDIAVIEVGLGGRLDATNIVKPNLSIITSISLEHTDLLGHDLESIAREKAGIIKPGIPVVAGPRTEKVIQTIATERKSPCFHVTGTFDTFELENRAVAKRAMEQLTLPRHSIDRSLSALPPCRMEEVRPRVILDVAHNTDGLQELFRALKVRYPNIPIRAVLALSKNKDLANCIAIVRQHATFIHLTEAASERAAPAEHLAQLLHGFAKISCHCDVNEAISCALAAKGNDLLVICGTFFIMAEARRSLGISEPSDALHFIEQGSSSLGGSLLSHLRLN